MRLCTDTYRLNHTVQCDLSEVTVPQDESLKLTSRLKNGIRDAPRRLGGRSGSGGG